MLSKAFWGVLQMFHYNWFHLFCETIYWTCSKISSIFILFGTIFSYTMCHGFSLLDNGWVFFLKFAADMIAWAWMQRLPDGTGCCHPSNATYWILPTNLDDQFSTKSLQEWVHHLYFEDKHTFTIETRLHCPWFCTLNTCQIKHVQMLKNQIRGNPNRPAKVASKEKLTNDFIHLKQHHYK